MIGPGSPAPAFSLPDQDGNRVSLSDFSGGTVVLVFYPADFSPVCTDQLSVYQEVLPQLEEQGAKLVGISVDGAFCHKAFQQHQGLSIPLLADFHPKGEVGEGLRRLVRGPRRGGPGARHGRSRRRRQVVPPLPAARDPRREPHL